MKKNSLCILALCFTSTVFAQTPSTNAVTINSSYVANSYIYVHPYVASLPITASGSGALQAQSGSSTTDPDDPKISFRLNKGTKFFVNKVITANNTITGYVISIWYYTNTPDKTAFYATLNPGGAPNPPTKKPLNQQQQQNQTQQQELTNLGTAVITQQGIVKAASDDVNSKTKALTDEKLALKNLQTNLDNTRMAFYQSSLYYTSNVSGFKTAQAAALAGETSASGLSTDVQQNLIQQSSNLPDDNSAFTKFKNAYKTADGAVTDLKKKINTDQDALATAIGNLAIQQAALRTQTINFTARSNQNLKDPKGKDFYNLTKLQVGDPQDDLSNAIDAAAVPYDPLAYLESWANGWQFYMSAKDFSDNTTMVYPRSLKFTWGFLTLPLKLRFDNPKYFTKGGEFTFEQNLNFGLTFGLKQQWTSTNDISMNYLLGLSVANVPLNDDPSAATGSSATVTPASTTAVSASIGAMFQYSKFQIGFFGGLDFAGAHANEFPFQGRPWLGFAIGVSLFGEGQTTASTQKQ